MAAHFRGQVPLFAVTVLLLVAGAVLASARFDMSIRIERDASGDGSAAFERNGAGDVASLLAASSLAAGVVCLTALIAGASRPVWTRTSVSLAALVAAYAIWGLRYTVLIDSPIRAPGDTTWTYGFDAWLVVRGGDLVGTSLRIAALTVFVAGALLLGAKAVREQRDMVTRGAGASGGVAANG